jgi:hypothetical protein
MGSCVVVPPTAREAEYWAPRNRLTPAQLWACVRMHYYFAVTAFAARDADVVVVRGADAPQLEPLLRRLQAEGWRVLRVRDVGNAPADPRTRAFVWCHTPTLQRCPVAVRLDLRNVLQCPRVTTAAAV